jgi:hypothetical protein
MIFWPSNRENNVLLGARHVHFENFFHVNTNIIFRGKAICSVSENRSESDGESEERSMKSEM